MAVAATTRVRIVWYPGFNLENEAVRPRDGSAYSTKSARESAQWNQVFPYVLFARTASSSARGCCPLAVGEEEAVAKAIATYKVG
jgi:hypothetical protein